jgi:DNA-nicking Smr family endonuclease
MPPRPRRLSEADQALWAAFTSQLAPLRGRVSRKPLQTQPPVAEPLPPATPMPPQDLKLAVPAKNPRRTTPLLSVGDQPSGIDKSTWQRFRTGKLQAGRRLDLHGMTTQRAFQALLTFLRNAHADQVRCVEVITGRGSGDTGGIIRREFAHWLNLPEIRPLILGAAHPHARNQGSVRLILRRIR